MILIFGGAYQGKLDYAKQNYNINTYFDCTVCLNEGEVSKDDEEVSKLITPDFSYDAIISLDKFVLECVDKGVEAVEFFKENREKWQDKVLIMTDVSQGIVPMDARLRAFREMNGRLMLYLTAEADETIRVFCGIGKRVK